RIKHSIPMSRGELDLGLDGTYYFENKFALAKTTPLGSALDRVGGPLSLKIRGRGAWTRGPLQFYGGINYSPSYDDPIGGLSGIPRSVASWTTVDLGMNYRTAEGSGWLSNMIVTLNAVNAFDEDPPFVNSIIGYDGANADPYGRLLSLELTRSW